MLPNDIFVLETNFGEKVIEFRNQDITKLKDKVDILVVSVFRGGYKPTPGTLVNSLITNCGINLQIESQSTAIDLKDNLNSWFSKEFEGQFFKRMLVVELRDKYGETSFNLSEAFNNIFGSLAVADVRGIKIKTVAMTLLGTGQQALELEEVMPILLEESKRALKTISHLEKIIYCERSEEKARKLYDLLNTSLGRTSIRFTEDQFDEVVAPILGDIKDGITKISHHADESANLQRVVSAWKEYVADGEFVIWQFGQFCRLFTEQFLMYYGWGKTYTGDAGKIITPLAKGNNFSPWVQSYLHLIRVTGNIYSHEKKDSIPDKTDKKDIIIALNSLQRVIEFWAQILEKKK